MNLSISQDLYQKIIVLIPAYNEEATVGEVIDEVRESLPGAAIAVINDGSADKTREMASQKKVFVLNHISNLGIGATVQTGLKFAKRHGFQIAVQVDGDGQHSPDDLAHLIAPLVRDEADVAIGSRFLGVSSFSTTLPRRIGIAFFTLLIFALTGKWISDPTSGFRAMNLKGIELFSEFYPGDYPEPQVLMTLHKRRFRMMEVPVIMKPRREGRSSISFFGAVYYMFKVTFAIFMELFRERKLSLCD